MAMHDAAPYLPHGGAMRLIDRVADDGSAYATIRADNPFLLPAGLPAWVGLEYMAQGVAAAHNLRARRAGASRPGVITSFKALRCQREWLDPALGLTVSSELLHADGGHAVSACRLWQGGQEVASVTLYTKEHDAGGQA
ncbi:hypothetical protein [Massilia sp. YMA4]|uniref:hypothetical protein n=1 Tax=Massilia sp. YMA4 TaxID=1593482 RepID=UPI000DD177F4|nr:hypothetical protein [Massilia sp. YMA4]AXA92288.1 hypothetical protein DPH57_14735 [Massilia sp. YMA4]